MKLPLNLEDEMLVSAARAVSTVPDARARVMNGSAALSQARGVVPGRRTPSFNASAVVSDHSASMLEVSIGRRGAANGSAWPMKRALATNKREAGMAKRFIPNGNLDFLTMASSFARTLERDPGRFLVSDDEAKAISQAVNNYKTLYHDANVSNHARNTVRDEAKRLIQRLAKRIRASDEIDDATRLSLGMSPEPTRRRSRTCPQEPPYLRFVQALHQGNGASAMHELRFGTMENNRECKPEGAVRIELFVGLIPPDQPTPIHPVQDQGTRVWYLRSYTRSPIKLAPPIPRVPMLVVYWARWADSTGNVGPFCEVVRSRMEGLTRAVPSPLNAKDRERLIDVSGSQSKVRDTDYSIAIIEAIEQSMMPQLVEPLPAKRLEDHSEREAA